MSSDSSPLILLLDDGELDDLRSLLEELRIDFAVRRGAAAREAHVSAPLLITTPRHLPGLAPAPGGVGAAAHRVHIVVVDDCSKSMRSVLERSRCDFVVRRPVHRAALVHLLRRALYDGPERRRLKRVAIGAQVRLRVGLRSGTATLVDLSLPGCLLLSNRAVESGRRVSVTLPSQLAGGKPLRLSGRVARVQEAERGETSKQAIAIALDSLDFRAELALRAVMKAHATGPATIEKAPATHVRGSPSTADSKDANTGTSHETRRTAGVARELNSGPAATDRRDREHVASPQGGGVSDLGRETQYHLQGHLPTLAEPCSASSSQERSAERLEESGENLLAAEAYRAVGDLAGAARCYERAYDLENALECYRAADDVEKVIALLEQVGDFFEAGRGAAEAMQWDRAIHDLQQVEVQHEQYSEACDLLAQILSDRGEIDLAIEKLEESLRVTGAAEAPLARQRRYAQLLEEAGRSQTGPSACEGIERRGGRDPSARIDALRKEGRQPAEAAASIVDQDLSAVADALERANAGSAAHLVRATWYRERGDVDSAARELEAAGHLSEAAELRSANSDHEGSAQLFEEAGVYVRAAEEYRTVSNLMSAARCYERAYDLDNAVECYRAAGDAEKMITLLERSGDFFEAGRSAAEAMQWDRAIHDLQQVDARHSQYGQACDLLAQILGGRGEIDLAIAKLEDVLRITGADDAPLEMQERYAQLLEEAGRSQDALTAYQRIRRRDPSCGDVNTRIEALRKKLSQLRAGAQAVVDEPAEKDERSRYEILAELGRGGMGVVYRARDRHLGRIVALKVLPENLRNHPTALELFEREARSAAVLNHANIVTVYDAGQEGGNYFISMEYLEGAGLDAVLERWGPLEARELAAVGVQVAAGLDYAQQKRIVHRDIKPSNLFLTRNRDVKIMDFGLAKMVEEVRRSSTVIGGTPIFMAPEQAVGGTVDHRTDLYSLGAAFFQLVTDTVPFEQGDPAYHHAHTPPPDPRERVATIPGAMAELILQLMAKNPEDRCQSAREVEERLRQILEG